MSWAFVQLRRGHTADIYIYTYNDEAILSASLYWVSWTCARDVSVQLHISVGRIDGGGAIYRPLFMVCCISPLMARVHPLRQVFVRKLHRYHRSTTGSGSAGQFI